MKYNDITRRYFEAAPNAGILWGKDVARGSAGDREASCWVQFDLRATAEVIREARFLALGCPHTIAVCAYLAEFAPGMRLGGALREDVEALSQRFAVPPQKRGRLLVIEDAWTAAKPAAR